LASYPIGSPGNVTINLALLSIGDGVFSGEPCLRNSTLPFAKFSFN
jgi:hypothetical protein